MKTGLSGVKMPLVSIRRHSPELVRLTGEALSHGAEDAAHFSPALTCPHSRFACLWTCAHLAIEECSDYSVFVCRKSKSHFVPLGVVDFKTVPADIIATLEAGSDYLTTVDSQGKGASLESMIGGTS